MLKLQRAAVLAHRAHRTILKAGQPLRLNFQRHLDFTTDQAGEMLQDLGDYFADASVRSLRVEFDPAVIARGLLFNGWRRRLGAWPWLWSRIVRVSQG